MKFMIVFVFLISLCANAQFKVSPIQNSVTGAKYCFPNGCVFPTELEANAWINSQQENNSWGRKAYVKDFVKSIAPTPGFTSCTDYVIDQEGNFTESSLIDEILRTALDTIGLGPEGEVEIARCSYPDEYAVPTITDVTAEETAKATTAAIDAAIEQNIKCGDKIIKLIARKNLSKGLTKEQIKTIVTTYSPILDLFKSGALNSGLEDVNALIPDGTLITNQDKIDIISEADGCKVVF